MDRAAPSQLGRSLGDSGLHDPGAISQTDAQYHDTPGHFTTSVYHPANPNGYQGTGGSFVFTSFRLGYASEDKQG